MLKKVFCVILVLFMLAGCSAKKADINNSPKLSEEQIAEYKAMLDESWVRELDYINSISANNFTFAIQTDTHFTGSDETTGYNMGALSYLVDLKFFAHLGDIIRGYADAEIDSPENMRDAMDEIVFRYTYDTNCDVFMTVGNHDANSMWFNAFKDTKGIITEQEHYNRIIEPLLEYNSDRMVTDGESVYYYADYDQEGIRIIMLNTADSKFSAGERSTFKISPAQIEWFKSEALDTDNSVIVMMHTPLIDDFTSGNVVENREQILEAVEDFVAGGGDFIAYMSGHIHLQESFKDTNGRLHMSFRNGSSSTEVVMVNKEKRTITTVGLGSAKMRTETY